MSANTKIARAAEDRPTPAKGRFPYPHRTCEQVREDEERGALLAAIWRKVA